MLRSNRQLASACGVSETTVRRWIARDAWAWGTGPWSDRQVVEIQAWQRELPPDKSELPGTQRGVGDPEVRLIKQKAEAQLAVERAGYTKAKRKALENELHDVAICQTEQTERIHRFKIHQRQFVAFDSARTIEVRFRENGWLLTPEQIHLIQEVIGFKLDETYHALSGE